MNHEEILKKVAKTLSLIANLLPLNRPSLILYPTACMQEAVARLYAHILKFFQQALKWYKAGKLSHSLNSVIRPWSVSFQDNVDAIIAEATKLRELTDMASKAELRDTHLEVLETRTELGKAREEIVALTGERRGLEKMLELRFEGIEKLLGCELTVPLIHCIYMVPDLRLTCLSHVQRD